MIWRVYLSGEIHSSWREEIILSAKEANLPIVFHSPIIDHQKSDAAGDVLGVENNSFWRDHKSSKINAIRTNSRIEMCDLVIICFSDKYKQWNAAFDAGYCAARNKPYITLHNESIIHPLKEVDAQAMAWTKTTAQIIEILIYITSEG